MKSIVFLVLVGIVILAASTLAAEDYCSTNLCGTKEHIACNNPGTFAKTCPTIRAAVDMGPYKDDIVKKHNELRNKLAKGQLLNFQPASRMATMQWDDELAKVAELNVKTCLFEHDCHNTVRFPKSGQNLGEEWSTEKFSSIWTVILSIIDSWWAENKDTTMKEINSYPENFKKVIGHFTVMTSQANDRVGCAVLTTEGEKFEVVMACNYAETNMINQKLYSSGTTASECKTGKNKNFDGLCSEREQY